MTGPGAGDLPVDRVDPHPDRLPRDPVLAARVVEIHRLALSVDEPGYVDPRSGLWVQTARTLWDRGHCCDTRCRHCPYVERPDPSPPR